MKKQKTHIFVLVELIHSDPKRGTTILNLENSLDQFCLEQDRFLSHGQQFFHNLGLIVRHGPSVAHAQHPKKVEEIRVLLLNQPGDEVLNVLVANAVHNGSVVTKEISQHPGRVDVKANLCLKEVDVTREIQRILLRSPVQVL